MEKLMLAGNKLEVLPVSMKDLDRLALLRISENNLKRLPGNILQCCWVRQLD